MRFLSALVMMLMGVVGYAKEEACLYHVDSKALEWTAFKTSKKAPVKGTFKTIELHSSGAGKSQSLESFLKGLTFKVDTLTLDTKNPARDENIVTNFFKKIAGKPEFTGKVVSVDLKKHKAVLELVLGGKKHKVPFEVKGSLQEGFEAKGKIDLLKVGLKTAFESLHQSCFDLHKGEDGKSKTWSDVELLAKLKVSCAKS